MEHSELPVKQTLAKLQVPVVLSITGTDTIRNLAQQPKTQIFSERSVLGLYSERCLQVDRTIGPRTPRRIVQIDRLPFYRGEVLFRL